ncbi:prepilin-type N-terminal cleavage/methylation domain-containing protein [Bradyrhizobium sp. INPA03-11B]|uniref:prepilin-type N-terminal cleavage/methylation domain-containing protein n=1 Tax=Bradyrhizobium sp. INPA03-11B TaxID=418598 RepID=UPI00338FBF47
MMLAKQTTTDNAEAGFTLIELLVGIVLLSLLTTAMFGSLRFGLLAWNHGTNHADKLQRVLLVQSLLTRLVAGAYPSYVTNDPSHPYVLFEGSPNALRFLAPAPIALGESGRLAYTLHAENRGSFSSLVMTSRSELAGGGDTKSSSTATLVDNVDGISFDYFGRGRADRDAVWHDRWSGEANPPTLVRLRVATAGQNWPDIIVVPRIEVDVGCVYDALTKRCRAR